MSFSVSGDRLVGAKEFVEILKEGYGNHDGRARHSNKEECGNGMDEELRDCVHVGSMPPSSSAKGKDSIRKS